MAGRSPARFIAPLALVAFALALFVVVSEHHQGRRRDVWRAGRRARGDDVGLATASGGKKKNAGRRERYTVKSGDTPSGIAEKVNVPLDTILELNPDLDPQALTPGTKIKLR